MAPARSQFRRALLGLHHDSSRLGVQTAVDVARLLDLEILGLFVQEDQLLQLATLPFAREFSPYAGWRSLDHEQLSRDLRAAATSAQKLFTRSVKDLPTACEFGVVTGSMTEAISAHARTDDIVVLSAPAALANHEAAEMPKLIETALRSAAAVMLVPRRIARLNGDIVAIAARRDDPSIHVAAAIADAAKEELAVIELFEANGRDAEARPDAGMIRRRSADKTAVSDPALLVSAFREERERLVVMTHGATGATLPTILASWRHVPVLVVEPSPPETDLTGEPRRE
jgi:hypothetical protein